MAEKYFIADLHFGHDNVIKFDKRPFKTASEMDEVMRDNWNKTVTDEDEIFILGDISWLPSLETENFLKTLKGKKNLIIGNHDGKYLKNANIRNQFELVSPYREIFIEDKLLVLCHYPIPCFKNHLRGAYHFYGHVHNTFEYEIMEDLKLAMEDEQQKELRMYNVGCMLPHMNYTPKTFEQIIEEYNYER